MKTKIVECPECGLHGWEIKLFDDNSKVELKCINCGFIEEAKLNSDV